MSRTLPRVLVLADVPNWAWDRKATAYRMHLSHQFDVTVAYHAATPPLHEFDLVHLFEVSQIGIASGYIDRPFKLIAGLTANVWRTWGADKMRRWAVAVDALHANSVLLHNELKQFHPKTYYTPNGVDADFFKRTPSDRPRKIIFGQVGKPNPRKGAAQIIEAGRKADVQVRLIQRTAKVAVGAEKMCEFYQDIAVQVTASNMDGTPNPMLEAAACECALLSTPIGNMPEFITTANGFLTKTELPYHGPDPVEGDVYVAEAQQTSRLVDELATLMSWFRDHPKETLEMGRAARETVLADWTWARQVRHVAQMWYDVLG